MPKSSRANKRNTSHAHHSEHAPQASIMAETPIKPLHKQREMSPRTRIIALAVGDIICFLIFASLGTNAHGQGVNLLNSLWVALPFVVAWFIVSPWVGAFRAGIATQPKRMAIRVMLAWLATWPVAMALRWLLVDRVSVPRVTPGAFLSFAVVALVFNLVILLIWRWPFAMNNGLRKRGL